MIGIGFFLCTCTPVINGQVRVTANVPTRMCGTVPRVLQKKKEFFGGLRINCPVFLAIRITYCDDTNTTSTYLQWNLLRNLWACQFGDSHRGFLENDQGRWVVGSLHKWAKMYNSWTIPLEPTAVNCCRVSTAVWDLYAPSSSSMPRITCLANTGWNVGIRLASKWVHLLHYFAM